MNERAVRVVVSGKVQGVGFRWFARERARALQLAGWVHNRADGNVEITVRGPEAAVDAFIVVLRRGPPGAQVHELLISPAHAGDEFPLPFSVQLSTPTD